MKMPEIEKIVVINLPEKQVYETFLNKINS